MVFRLVIKASLHEREEPVGKPPVSLDVSRRQNLELKERRRLSSEIRLHSLVVRSEDDAVVESVRSLMEKHEHKRLLPADKENDRHQNENVQHYMCCDCTHLNLVVVPSRVLVSQSFDARDTCVEGLPWQVAPE